MTAMAIIGFVLVLGLGLYLLLASWATFRAWLAWEGTIFQLALPIILAASAIGVLYFDFKNCPIEFTMKVSQ